jgi:putative hydrolase of the HAD superfamily
VNRGRVRALFFDVGGTLIHPWPSVGAIYASAANRHGWNVTADQMETAFHESWAALKQPGELTVSRKDWWRELVFRALGQPNEACFEELFEAFAHAGAWRVYPDVEETLRAARARGLHVGAISNWDERLRPLLREIGLARWFDSVTVSCEVGAEKPASAVFQAALGAAGVAANEAVHVGDSYAEDVLGAETAGMRAVLIDRSGNDQHDCASISPSSSVRKERSLICNGLRLRSGDFRHYIFHHFRLRR